MSFNATKNNVNKDYVQNVYKKYKIFVLYVNNKYLNFENYIKMKNIFVVVVVILREFKINI